MILLHIYFIVLLKQTDLIFPEVSTQHVQTVEMGQLSVAKSYPTFRLSC